MMIEALAGLAWYAKIFTNLSSILKLSFLLSSE